MQIKIKALYREYETTCLLTNINKKKIYFVIFNNLFYYNWINVKKNQ